MASETQIANRALQILGAGRIASIDDATPAAAEMKLAYEPVRDALLRAFTWSFAIKRLILAPDSAVPVFGLSYQFTLPSDCLRPLVEKASDWRVEGRKLLTDTPSTLELRYIRQETDPNVFDPLFRECLAAKLAWETCERITQSNTKKDEAGNRYALALSEARKAGAIENPPEEPEEDDWVNIRSM